MKLDNKNQLIKMAQKNIRTIKQFGNRNKFQQILKIIIKKANKRDYNRSLNLIKNYDLDSEDGEKLYKALYGRYIENRTNNPLYQSNPELLAMTIDTKNRQTNLNNEIISTENKVDLSNDTKNYIELLANIKNILNVDDNYLVNQILDIFNDLIEKNETENIFNKLNSNQIPEELQFLDENVITLKELSCTVLKYFNIEFYKKYCEKKQSHISIKDKIKHFSQDENIYIHFDKKENIEINKNYYAVPYNMLRRIYERFNSPEQFKEYIENNFTELYGENIFIVKGEPIANRLGFDLIKITEIIRKVDDIDNLFIDKLAFISVKDKLKKQASIIDYPYSTLPQDLWEEKNGKYKLKPEIRQKIIDIINNILDNNFKGKEDWFKTILFGGSTGTQFYTNEGDLDIKIVIDYNKFLEDNPEYKEYSDELQKELIKKVREEEFKINNRPIDLYIYGEDEIKQKGFLNKYDSLYDVMENRWIKEPKIIDVDKYDRQKIVNKGKEKALEWAKKFDLDVGSIKRHIKDYEQIKEYLSHLSNEEKNKFKEEIEKILADLENEIEEIVQEKDEIVEERHKGFEIDYNIDNLEDFITSINWISDANIAFKLVQHWNYLKLAKELSKLLEDEKITEDEVPEIKRIIQENTISIKDKLIKQSNKYISAKDKLKKYKEKRNPEKTPEPFEEKDTTTGDVFVIQDHKAKKAGRHWDFRIEEDGVLKSFVIKKRKLPKGKEKILCVPTENHPVQYWSFSGKIPEGYGAGTVKIYDRGTVDKIEGSIKSGKLVFKLNGKKEKGTYKLYKTPIGWMLQEVQKESQSPLLKNRGLNREI